MGIVIKAWPGQEEVGVGEMEMETLIGDDQCVRVFCGSFHLLFCTTPWVRAPVITPAEQKKKDPLEVGTSSCISLFCLV